MKRYILFTDEELVKLIRGEEIEHTNSDGTILYFMAKEHFAKLAECEGAEEPYKPVCPRGYTDCVCDPAYIKYHHPEWYKEMYGDLSPEEAARIEDSCYDRFREDPDEKYYCYDDEDK